MKDIKSIISLRAVEPEDADFMFEAEQDPDAWKYSDYVAPLSKELLTQYALNYDADPFRSGQLRLIIDYKNTPIGIADIFDISTRHLRADTGIYILPTFRGRGFAKEALEMLSEFCKVRLGLHQITACISELNTAAECCYFSAGFRLTGMRPDWVRTPQGYESANIYALILNRH